MKKILLLFFVIFLTACSILGSYDEISYKKLNNMLENKESFILFIGSATCTHCDAYKVTLNKVISDYKVDVKYIDISKLSEKEKSKLRADFPISGTPTTIFIKNGKEKDTSNRLVGSVRYSKIVQKFKENKYIKE